MSKTAKNYEKCSRLIVEYLAGERTNPRICTTSMYAKNLEKEFHIKLQRGECVRKDKNLYMYEIIE